MDSHKYEKKKVEKVSKNYHYEKYEEIFGHFLFNETKRAFFLLLWTNLRHVISVDHEIQNIETVAFTQRNNKKVQEHIYAAFLKAAFQITFQSWNLKIKYKMKNFSTVELIHQNHIFSKVNVILKKNSILETTFQTHAHVN